MTAVFHWFCKIQHTFTPSFSSDFCNQIDEVSFPSFEPISLYIWCTSKSCHCHQKWCKGMHDNQQQHVKYEIIVTLLMSFWFWLLEMAIFSIIFEAWIEKSDGVNKFSSACISHISYFSPNHNCTLAVVSNDSVLVIVTRNPVLVLESKLKPRIPYLSKHDRSSFLYWWFCDRNSFQCHENVCSLFNIKTGLLRCCFLSCIGRLFEWIGTRGCLHK
jgi:hypothetical protein